MDKKKAHYFNMYCLPKLILLLTCGFCILAAPHVPASDQGLPKSSVSELGYVFDRDQTSLELRWTVSEQGEEEQAFSYQVIDRDGLTVAEKQAVFSPSDGRYSDTVPNLDPEMLYRFRVSRTADSESATVWSKYKTAVPQPVLLPSSRMNSRGQAELYWNPVSGVETYTVLIADSPVGNYMTAAETTDPSIVVSYYDGHSFEPDTDYYAKIKGVAEDGSASYTTLYTRLFSLHADDPSSGSSEEVEILSDEQLQELADSLFEETAHKEKDYAGAFRYFLAAAEAGSTVGQCYTGYSLQNAYGTKKSSEKAYAYYIPAVEKNFPQALNAMGVLYYYGQYVDFDYLTAAKYYRMAADLGYAEAQCNIGLMYKKGYGVEQNYETAFSYYLKAAEQGNNRGLLNVGWFYENGKGVARNTDEAVKYYRIAAEQGMPEAQKALDLLT